MEGLRTSSETLATSPLTMWLKQLSVRRHRGMLVFSGEADWCRAMAMQMLSDSSLERISWLSTLEQSGVEVLSGKQARSLLGQERDAIVFDAHAGFDADAFGAVSGTIVGGGLLVLLCPSLDEWSQVADPAAESIAVWPHGVDDLPGRFIQRMVRLLKRMISAAEQVVFLTPGKAVDDSLSAMLESSAGKQSALQRSPSTTEVMDDGVFRSQDQRAAVEAIEHVLHGHRRRPLVLVADRGRGKTAALGIAAAQLLRGASHGLSQTAHASPRALRIVVTAPRLSAVAPLFQLAQSLLPNAEIHAGRLLWGDAEIRFVAPDELCASRPVADLLLVDEAAAIPVSILQPLLTHYSRIVFSTTTHGYEGTGRGFAVRFVQTLNEQAPGWTQLVLQQPIRWAEDDPLEKWVFDCLLLNAKCAEDDAVSSVDISRLKVERISRTQLLDDESLLTQLFGLLVVAHYRTRPDDLRNLLDGPGLAVYVMRQESVVLATALVATEGGFDAPLSKEITAGRRRPRGHLLPQSLMAHLGLASAGELRCARVMRIAVHPAVQRRGLGRKMLQHIKVDAKNQGADIIGASFGATASLLSFWNSENLWPVRVGFRRGHSSGEHSVMVLFALGAVGESLVADARQCLLLDLPQTLLAPLNELDAEVVALLLQKRNSTEIEADALGSRDIENAKSFIEGGRNYDDCLASIWRCVVWALRDAQSMMIDVEQRVLIAKVLQGQPWSVVAQHFSLAGQADVKKSVQLGLRQLLQRVEK